ncbi:hypothetical protein GGF46_000590 [Coemansia sp. RSA 552]|nr:hypothetical protein GGF46_000590 [Coemansia sp. RSA 552]
MDATSTSHLVPMQPGGGAHNDMAGLHNRKDSSTFPPMNSQITMFKITISAGNAIEQPIRPGDRFSGVLVVQLSRPISATQVVLSLTAAENWATTLKGATRPERTQIFSSSLVLWKAVRKGVVNASTVLSDGLHVFNFICQVPNINYPQNVKRDEYDISYNLEAKLMAPKDYGSESVAGSVTKELCFTPLIVLPPNVEPLVAAETLYFDKKGKRGKPAVEVRASAAVRQLLPGSKVKLELTIKELSSSSWTRIMVRLFERTRCRISTQMPFSQPLWSAERELAYTEAVRSSVYSYFINEDSLGKTTTETKTASGESIATESVLFHIPAVSYGAMNTEHLEFSHFIRVEVIIPGWLSSERSVFIDLPVQMMTCEIHSAARFLSRRGSIPSIEQKSENDTASVVSGKSSASSGLRSENTAQRSLSLSSDTQAMIMNSLPPKYYDIPVEQRPAPALTLIKQSNMSNTQDPAAIMAQQQHMQMQQQHQGMASVQPGGQPMRNQTISSMQSAEGRTSSSGNSGGEDFNKEKYRSRPLPMAPGALSNPPPLPADPMPTSVPQQGGSNTRPSSRNRQEGHVQQMNIDVQRNMRANPLVLSPYDDEQLPLNEMGALRCESPVGGNSMPPEDAYVMAGSKMHEHQPNHMHAPISPPYNGNNTGHASDGFGDSANDGPYFKDAASGRQMGHDYANDNARYQAHQNSSINHF